MHRLILLLFSLHFCAVVFSSEAAVPTEKIKAVQKTDFCKLDQKNTYEVYIPERDKSVGKLPLLVIIDAHGSGKFAIDKFKQGANQYPAVLIASNLVKNGFDGYEGAIRILIEDVRQKYPVGETIFVTGFSGGARMALGYALSHPVNGLILCGALASTDQINALRCPVISISGMDDFNFVETAHYLFREQSIPGNLKIELTNGSHNWPDSQMLANAFGFLSLSHMVEDHAYQETSLLKIYCENQKTRINAFKQQGDFLKAALVARNLSSSSPFNSDKTFASTYGTLKANPEYTSQMNRLEKSLQFELGVRQSYLDAFETKDTVWWKNEIRTTDEKIKTEKDPYTKDSYRRIKGFWGIVSYTFCKRAIAEKNVVKLNKILCVYRMLESQNPDLFYFSSFIYLWKGNSKSTISMLKKSLAAGFSDKGQLKKDFPASITSALGIGL